MKTALGAVIKKDLPELVQELAETPWKRGRDASLGVTPEAQREWTICRS
jgi:hypothetical protein